MLLVSAGKFKFKHQTTIPGTNYTLYCTKARITVEYMFVKNKTSSLLHQNKENIRLRIPLTKHTTTSKAASQNSSTTTTPASSHATKNCKIDIFKETQHNHHSSSLLTSTQTSSQYLYSHIRNSTDGLSYQHNHREYLTLSSSANNSLERKETKQNSKSSGKLTKSKDFTPICPSNSYIQLMQPASTKNLTSPNQQSHRFSKQQFTRQSVNNTSSSNSNCKKTNNTVINLVNTSPSVFSKNKSTHSSFVSDKQNTSNSKLKTHLQHALTETSKIPYEHMWKAIDKSLWEAEKSSTGEDKDYMGVFRQIVGKLKEREAQEQRRQEARTQEVQEARSRLQCEIRKKNKQIQLLKHCLQKKLNSGASCQKENKDQVTGWVLEGVVDRQWEDESSMVSSSSFGEYLITPSAQEAGQKGTSVNKEFKEKLRLNLSGIKNYRD